MTTSCVSCKKGPPEVSLKNCAKCKGTKYCSRECQKADWKAHKKVCGKPGGTGPSTTAGSTAATEPGTASSTSEPKLTDSTPHLSPTVPATAKGLKQIVLDPFTRLANGTWLHDRPEIDVYRLLLDSYRMKVEDDYVFDGELTPGSLYTGAPHGLRGFRHFMRAVETKPGLLPPWWDPAVHHRRCEGLGMDQTDDHGLMFAIEKKDIIEHYGDVRFPMQLRMFAGSVFGRGPGGSDGTELRTMLSKAELGLLGGKGDHLSMLNIDMSDAFSQLRMGPL